MKHIIILTSILFNSIVFAGKPTVGARYIGVESVSNEPCQVVIKKIESNFPVDNISLEITLAGRELKEITLGEYDLTNGRYARLGDYISVKQKSNYSHREVIYPGYEYFSLQVSENKSTANFRFDLMVEDGVIQWNAMASTRPIMTCLNMELEEKTKLINPTP